MASYLRNRTPTQAVPDKTPFQLLCGDVPDVQHLRVFGCTCVVFVQRRHRDKLAPTGVLATFLGYDPQGVGYLVRQKGHTKVIVSRDVRFYEDEPPPEDDQAAARSEEPVVSFEGVPAARPHRAVAGASPIASRCVAEAPDAALTPAPELCHDEAQLPHQAPDVLSPVSPVIVDVPARPLRRIRIDPVLAELGVVPPPTGAAQPPVGGTPDESPLIADVPARQIRRVMIDPVPAVMGAAPSPVAGTPAESPALTPPELELSPPPVAAPPEAGAPQNAAGVTMQTHRDRPHREVRPPDRFGFLASDEPSDPFSVETALAWPHVESWRKAMDMEISALTSNGTWRLVRLPDGRSVMPCKWVLKVKRHSDGTFASCKARLVVKGFAQRPGVDYGDTYAPAASLTTFRVLLALTAQHGWTAHQLHVSSAFLNGTIEEDLFMWQPPYDDQGGGLVCKLQKSLYGLKQAPRAWHKALSAALKEIKLQVSEKEPGVYYACSDECLRVVVLIWVDDMLVCGPDLDEGP